MKKSDFKTFIQENDVSLLKCIRNEKINKLFALLLIELKDFWTEKKDIKKIKESSKDFFFMNLYMRISELDKKLNDLRIGKELVFQYPYLRTKDKTVFNKVDYINYNVEYFFINIIGVVDRVLHIVSFVYKLPLPANRVTVKTILNNPKVDENVKNFLEKFNKSIKNIRNVQNMIKHRVKYYDNDIYTYDALEHIAELYDALSEPDKRDYFRRLAKNEYRSYRDKLYEILEQLINFVCEETEEFLKFLLPIILKEYSHYEEASIKG